MMEFLIVTGLSGAGKTQAVHALEDIGFYCVDNLPPQLLETFYSLCQQAGEKFGRVAVVTDIRGGQDVFLTLAGTLEEMRREGKPYKILFLNASDSVLINRFKETRRKHPLADFFLGSLDKAVQMERSVLQPVREMADYVIDTSLLAPAQLKKQLASLFLGSAQDALSIHCLSFGFKYGLPPEADLVFDVRCLPNPYYMPELKQLTGLDDPVRNYVMRWEQSQEVKKRLFNLIDYMLPLYVEEGKSQLVVAVGCTGGKHRSVTFAQLLYEHFSAEGKKVSVSHRDIQKR